MKTRINKSSKQLFSTLVACGLVGNVVGAIIAYNIDDFILVGLCLTVAVISLFGLFLSYSNKASAAIHLVVLTYFVIFIAASFTHLVFNSVLLVYPIMIGIATLFFKKPSTQNFYFIVALIGSTITIVNTHYATWGEGYAGYLAVSLLIGLGLLAGFVITIILHSKKLAKHRLRRSEDKQAIIDSNMSMKEYIKTNLQLENFAHLASHELKTPIKNISNFSQLLDKRIGGILGDKDQDILHHIKEESQRMCVMMADLLKLSQLSKTKIKYKTINGHKFIKNLIDENFKIDKGFIVVNSFPLEMKAAESHIQILFYNLIENAIKFCDKNEDPKITIYGRRSHKHFYFEVKDNGVGIDDKYKDLVFLIFNKLNPQINSESTGIGLSMCREIVERHNGRIWIEDNIEGGTVVKFTIGRNVDQPVIEDFSFDQLESVDALTA